jgi:ectoine hydroxylase-related dioxygenase (phytanoyl-CoA dioxygenase family)
MSTIICNPIEISNRSDQHRTFGLTAMHALLECPGRTPSKTFIEVGGHAVEFDARETCVELNDGTWRIVFHVVTHLFPDGLLSAKLSIELDDGATATFAERFFAVDNGGALAREVAEDLRTHGTPMIIARYVDSSHFPYNTGRARAWFDMEQSARVELSFDPSPDMKSAHKHLEHWGFCVLPELLPLDLVERFKVEVRAAIAAGDLDYVEGTSQRIHNAHRLEAGRQIWLYPQVMQFLTDHFRDRPCACQTLTYINGSEQNAHQDTIHLTPYPAGYMAGVWVALEDVQPDSGELFVYPGSHRTPRLRAKELGLSKVDDDYSSYAKFDAQIAVMMEEGGFERHAYRAKAGQILVWHENLVHGGSVRLDKSRTRFSVVSHYFAKGAVAYYDSRGEAAALEELPGVA